MVGCDPPEKRKPYLLEWGGAGGVQVWCWTCPVTGERITDHDRKETVRLALAHDCGGAGWCEIPMTPARVALLGLPHLPEPTGEDRKRWLELKRSKRKPKIK